MIALHLSSLNITLVYADDYKVNSEMLYWGICLCSFMKLKRNSRHFFVDLL